MLERPGVTVTCCHHPEELLNKLKDKRFDALLTDIQMPAMNGFDLLKAIRTLDTSWVRTLPVIALTARSDMDENYFRSHGFAGCLPQEIRLLTQHRPKKTIPNKKRWISLP